MTENCRTNTATSFCVTLRRKDRDFLRSFFSRIETGAICSRRSVAPSAWALLENRSPLTLSFVRTFRPRNV